MTGNYDPALNLVYWGVGNAAPWPGDLHPGDNLYTSSVLALDPGSGKDQGLPPIPPERLLGLGRSRGADADRSAKGRADDQGPGPPWPRRRFLGAGAQRGQDQVRRG